MKINTCSKMLWILSVVLAAGLFSRSANAISIGYTLELTEVSSTVLTYTYTNATNPTPFTVSNVTTDIWNISIAPQSNIIVGDHENLFAEGPGEAGKVNFVLSFASSNSLTVNSDQPRDMSDPPDVTSAIIGTDNGVPITLRFIDQAAASETAGGGVPEGGSSLLLLGLSVAGIAGLNRFRRLQLA